MAYLKRNSKPAHFVKPTAPNINSLTLNLFPEGRPQLGADFFTIIIDETAEVIKIHAESFGGRKFDQGPFKFAEITPDLIEKVFVEFYTSPASR